MYESLELVGHIVRWSDLRRLIVDLDVRIWLVLVHHVCSGIERSGSLYTFRRGITTTALAVVVFLLVSCTALSMPVSIYSGEKVGSISRGEFSSPIVEPCPSGTSLIAGTEAISISGHSIARPQYILPKRRYGGDLHVSINSLREGYILLV